MTREKNVATQPAIHSKAKMCYDDAPPRHDGNDTTPTTTTTNRTETQRVVAHLRLPYLPFIHLT